MMNKHKNGNKLDVQKFVMDFFDSIDAVIEPVSYAYVEILIPEQFVSYFEAQELRLAFDPEVAEEKQAEFITIGSPLLDKIINLIVNQKKVLKRHIILEQVQLPNGTADLISNSFNFYKCRTPEINESEIEEHHFLCFLFEINLTSDEKQKYLEKVFIDMYQGRIVSKKQAQKLKKAFYDQNRNKYYPLPSFINVDHAYKLATKQIKKISRNRKNDFEKKLKKYKQKELKQVKQFYKRRRFELEEKIENLKEKNVQNKDTRLKKLKNKLEANQINKKRRLNDIQDKYSCEVEVKLDSLINYTLPRIRTTISIQKRQNIYHLDLLFNPLTREFESLFCSNCRCELSNVYIDDNEVYCKECKN